MLFIVSRAAHFLASVQKHKPPHSSLCRGQSAVVLSLVGQLLGLFGYCKFLSISCYQLGVLWYHDACMFIFENCFELYLINKRKIIANKFYIYIIFHFSAYGNWTHDVVAFTSFFNVLFDFVQKSFAGLRIMHMLFQKWNLYWETPSVCVDSLCYNLFSFF